MWKHAFIIITLIIAIVIAIAAALDMRRATHVQDKTKKSDVKSQNVYKTFEFRDATHVQDKTQSVAAREVEEVAKDSEERMRADIKPATLIVLIAISNMS